MASSSVSSITRDAIYNRSQDLAKFAEFYDRLYGILEKKSKVFNNWKNGIDIACYVVCSLGLIGSALIPIGVFSLEQREWVAVVFANLLGLTAVLVSIANKIASSHAKKATALRLARDETYRIKDTCESLLLMLDVDVPAESEVIASLDIINQRLTVVRSNLPNLNEYQGP